MLDPQNLHSLLPQFRSILGAIITMDSARDTMNGDPVINESLSHGDRLLIRNRYGGKIPGKTIKHGSHISTLLALVSAVSQRSHYVNINKLSKIRQRAYIGGVRLLMS